MRGFVCALQKFELCPDKQTIVRNWQIRTLFAPEISLFPKQESGVLVATKQNQNTQPKKNKKGGGNAFFFMSQHSSDNTCTHGPGVEAKASETGDME